MSDIPSTFRLSEPSDFGIEVNESGTEVSVRGELDILTAPLLWERLEPLLPLSVSRLVIDLGGTRFIDSMGLGVLVRAHKRLRSGDDGDGGLVVRSPSEQTRKILEMTGLDRVFDVEA